ncbi:MAG TPA: hypothetical protein VGJ28_14495 [Micromonosporaceae bacterium]|jgi:4-hydroxy-3-methylbut-2-enyl diphosphate reductase
MTAVIYAPLRVERFALRRARSPLVRVGMGPSRQVHTRAAVVAGLGGGLADGVRPGDVVVATEVLGDGRTVTCSLSELLADELTRIGLTVHLGPIWSERKLVTGAARRELARSGALAVDMESIWLAPGDGTPFAAVRVISDTDDAPLLRPGTVTRGITALRVLGRTVPALDAWVDQASSLMPKEVS